MIEYRTLGKFTPDIPKPEDVKAAMAVRDLMSATLSLCELPSDLAKCEAHDIELAHARLGNLLSRIINHA